MPQHWPTPASHWASSSQPELYLQQLGVDLIGYGCTTCIGNSGTLVSAAVTGHDLTVSSVPSDNRNLEGRIHAECR